jgi:tight adherence protein C
MNASALGAGAGLLAGVSLLLVASWAASRRAPRLVDRIGPFVGLASSGERPGGLGELAVLLVALVRSPSMSRHAGDRELSVRLRRAGRRASAIEYRLERLGWSALGGVGGLALAALLAAGGSSPLGLILLSGGGAVAGWAACDAALRRSVRDRQRRIAAQVPSLADLLALAVAAGAPPLSALDEAAATLSGPLGEEIADSVSAVRTGTPLTEALPAMAARVGIDALRRLVEALVVALERGTPLAEVLRAQALDARAADRRRLMELAGRKDVLMLVPVVFLVLPSVVLVAIYPGAQSLRVLVP